MKLPFRKRDYSCLTRLTYKYFVEPERAAAIWDQLASELGPIQRIPAVRVQQIATPQLIVRATFDGNPITVMQRNGEPGGEKGGPPPAIDAQLARLHAIFGFTEEPQP